MKKLVTHYPRGQRIQLRRSEFQTLAIYQDDKLRLLSVDEKAIQRTCNIDAPHRLILPHTQSMMGLLLFQPPPKQALMLGLGGGDMARFLHHYIPQSEITAVDIDKEVMDIAKEYFMLPTSRIKLVCDDALHFLQTNNTVYDSIFIDLYSADGIPPTLHSWEFFQYCQSRLSEHGAMALNVITDDPEMFRDIVLKVRQSFNYLSLCLKVPGHKNIIIFGFNKKPKQKGRNSLYKKAKQLSHQYELDFDNFVEELFNTNPLENGELII